MSEGRIVGGCDGNFPESEVDKERKEEKTCCHGGCVQCNCETGCGLGPVKEGSVQDASGTSVLSQKSKLYIKEEYLVVTQDSKYLVDINEPRQSQNMIYVLMNFKVCVSFSVTIFGLKRTEVLPTYHTLALHNIIRVIPWDLEKWKAETSEGVV